MKPKTHFCTNDIFNIGDAKTNMEALKHCAIQAKKCGLICKPGRRGDFLVLALAGTKCQFLKYYLRTLPNWESKQKGLKRVVDVILIK